MTPVQAMLHAATGLSLSRTVVERAVRQRMARTATRDQDTYLKRITPEELEALVELVVVPESWFYRDPQAFQAACEHVRRRLAAGAGTQAGGRPVRILSIPCAGGEEPYTMAMVLADAGIAPDSYSIDAYDISPGCVARAKQGVYGRNAFRSQDMAFRERHFSAAGDDDYRIADAIRKQVRIRQGNLLELGAGGAGSGSYDVIFCRNLLIYFDKPTTKAAIAALDSLLNADGQLFAGYAEVPSFCAHGFAPLPYPQAFGLVKEAAAPPRLPLVRPALATPALRRLAPLPVPRPARPGPSAPPQMIARQAGKAGAQLAPALPAASAAAPAATENLLEQARKLADLGQADAAEKKCHDHLARQPDSAEAYFILGLLNEHASQNSQAEGYWRRCIYLQPDHYEALCHLALLAETNNDPATAAALKARAARIYKRQQAS